MTQQSNDQGSGSGGRAAAFTAIGVVADAAGIAALMTIGGVGLAVFGGLLAVIVGIAALVTAWARQNIRFAAAAVAILVVGGGLVGFGVSLQVSGRSPILAAPSATPAESTQPPTSSTFPGPVPSGRPGSPDVGGTTPGPSSEPEVLKRGTVKLNARTQIDLDSTADNWGVAKEGEEPYTDVWMNLHDVSAVNDAVMAKASGPDHAHAKSATQMGFLENGELKRETVYLAVKTNDGHLATIVIDPDKVTYDNGFFNTFTVDIVVWSD